MFRFLLILLVFAVVVVLARRLFGSGKDEGSTPRLSPCSRCRDASPLQVESFPVVGSYGGGSIRRCPVCDALFDYNEIAFGGGRVKRLDA